MNVPGSNLLAAALTVICPQEFRYFRYQGKTINVIGLDEHTYDAPITLHGSVQSVDNDVYHERGLDFQRQYIEIFVSQDINPHINCRTLSSVGSLAFSDEIGPDRQNGIKNFKNGNFYDPDTTENRVSDSSSFAFSEEVGFDPDNGVMNFGHGNFNQNRDSNVLPTTRNDTTNTTFRARAGDQIEFNRMRWQVIDDDDWNPIDGWDSFIAVEVVNE